MTGRERKDAAGFSFRALFCLLVSIAVFWIAGYVFFCMEIAAMDKGGTPAGGPAGAIVVLTGGPNRVNTGFDLLSSGAAGELFISGAGGNVSAETLLSLWRKKNADGPLPACCITIGYDARNTAQNAAEARRWIEEKDVASIYLVTGAYHMPRALLEFRNALPGLDIRPLPVRTGKANPFTALTEYNKTLFSWIRTKTS